MTTFVDSARSDFNRSTEQPSSFDADILWRDQAGDDVLWLMSNDTAGAIAPLPAVTPDPLTSNLQSCARTTADNVLTGC